MNDTLQPPAPPSDSMKLSVIVPMFNEEENIEQTVQAVAATLAAFKDGPWEIIVVNDGSLDRTGELATELAARPDYPWLRAVGYAVNRGRGFALRTGFAAARGEWIVAIDADLSYDAGQILNLTQVLRIQPEIDFVLASAYMPGGQVEGVPADRLLISRAGNKVLSWFMSSGRQRLHTITCVFRAYRRYVLDNMELESEGKDIHLEILSKAIMLGYRYQEVPAVLRARKKGHSKFRLRATASSHLVFALFEKPILVFGVLGLISVFFGLGILLTGLYHYVNDIPFNWQRPLITIMVLTFLGGIGLIAFGIIGTQLVNLRKEVIKMQARLKQIQRDK